MFPFIIKLESEVSENIILRFRFAFGVSSFALSTCRLKTLSQIWNIWLDKMPENAEGQAQLPLPGNNLKQSKDVIRF